MDDERRIEDLVVEMRAEAAVAGGLISTDSSTLPVDDTTADQFGIDDDSTVATAPRRPGLIGEIEEVLLRASSETNHRIYDQVFGGGKYAIAAATVEELQPKLKELFDEYAGKIQLVPQAALSFGDLAPLISLLNRLERNLTKPIGDLADPANLAAARREVHRVLNYSTVSEGSKLRWRDIVGDAFKLLGGRAVWITVATAGLAVFFVGACLGVVLSPSEAPAVTTVAAVPRAQTTAPAAPQGGTTVDQWANWLWDRESGTVMACVTQARSAGRDVLCPLAPVSVN